MQKEHLPLKILFAMLKFSGIHLLLVSLTFSMSVAKDGLAQEMLTRPVTLDIFNKDVRTTLSIIEKSANVKFSYEPTIIPKHERTTLVAKGDPLASILNKLLKPLDLNYEVSGKYIILTKNRRLESSEEVIHEGTLSPLDVKVSGKVTDERGEGLPGVSILVKGTQTGTTTDVTGVYTIDLTSSNVTLVFSFVGYESQEFKLGTSSRLNVSLKPSSKSLEDVVVIGYGTSSRKDLTGAVASVSAKQLEKVVINTAEQALQGRVAGVQVSTDSHAPGGGISVQIRGTASISASGQPLYVIDGYPISNDFMRYGVPDGDGGAPNPLNSIDPSNIASIEILKDASSTAIYGSRATNGVVLITTKRGSSGRPTVEYKTNVSFDKPSKYLDFINATEYAQLVNERDRTNKVAETFTAAEVAAMGEGTNWQKEVFRTAASQRHQLSVSGGNNGVRYMVSGNYTDQNGVVTGTNFKRYGMNVNLDTDINSKLTVGTNLMITNTVEKSLPNDTKGYSTQPSIMSNIFYAKPHIPARDQNGDFTLLNSYKAGTGEENPLYMAYNYNISTTTSRLLGSVFANYEFVKGLSLKVRVGVDYRNWVYKSYYPIKSRQASAQGGSAQQTIEKTVNVLNENTLEYKTNFGKNRVSVIAGFTSQNETDEFLSALAYGFPSDFYAYNNMALASTPQAPSSGATKWRLVSYLGRANFAHNDKYLLTMTARYDGSSKFGANNKYGFFPSAAVAWKISNEEFIKQMPAISNLKLRFGYGSTGNERIGLYKSISTITTVKNYSTGYIFGGNLVPVAYQANIPNPDLSWEKSTDMNLGVDLGLFKDRVSLTVDLYKKKTTQLLLDVPIPDESGFKSVLKNVGAIQNRGVEFSLQTVNIQSAITWSTNMNLSVNRNTVLNLGGAKEMFQGWVGGASMGFNNTNVVRLAPGHPVGAIYGAVAEGIWKSRDEINAVGTMKSSKPGDMRFKDLNNDGVFAAEDCMYIGNPNPNFTFGFNNDLSYKQWGLTVVTYGSIGQDVMFLTKKRIAGDINLWRPDREDRWSETNPNGTHLGATSGYPSYVSTDNVYKASFWRIKNIALSYSLPTQSIKWMQSAMLTLALDNMLVITKYPGYDPEVNSYGSSNTVKGMDRFSYPALKSMRIGFNVRF